MLINIHLPEVQHLILRCFLLQRCIYNNAMKLIELCVVKLPQDWFPLLDLLAMVLNPGSK